MQASGFSREDFAQDPVELWPENWPAWVTFCEVSTQWRTAGVGGVFIGLDYGPLFTRMDRQGLTGQDWQDRFDDIRTLEAQALETLSEQKP